MIGTVEQIVLLRTHRRQAIYELRINEDMTGAAGTTSTAKRQQFTLSRMISMTEWFASASTARVQIRPVWSQTVLASEQSSLNADQSDTNSATCRYASPLPQCV
jgi:hypothetical protein